MSHYDIHFPKGRGAALSVAGIGRLEPGATVTLTLTEAALAGMAFTPLEVTEVSDEEMAGREEKFKADQGAMRARASAQPKADAATTKKTKKEGK